MDCRERFWVEFYTDAGGHNAMPPSKLCLRQMAEDLARPLPPAPEYTPGPDGFLSRFYAAVSEAE